MLSENLEQSLHKAMTCAADRRAELVTLEHLLYALIDDNEVTLKKFSSYKNSIALEPANKNFKTRIFGMIEWPHSRSVFPGM